MALCVVCADLRTTAALLSLRSIIRLQALSGATSISSSQVFGSGDSNEDSHNNMRSDRYAGRAGAKEPCPRLLVRYSFAF